MTGSNRIVVISWTALLVALAVGTVAGNSDEPWQNLEPGLELARFEVGEAVVEVLRIDPALWQTVALAVSDLGGDNRTMRQWATEFDLAAVINAGMYATDLRTHTGYFHTGDHVNNPRWVQRDYRQAACFEPREAGLPRFVLQDLDAVPESTFVHHYDIVIQNLRLVRKTRENRWQPQSRRWSEACLGEDARGRLLWIYCRRPLDMHAFNEIILGLPLELVAAQHLEGGAQARLWLNPDPSGVQTTDPGPLLPNVLGLRPRDGHSPG